MFWFRRPGLIRELVYLLNMYAIVFTLLSALSPGLAPAQETPPPDYLKPRQTKQLAEIRDAIQKATNIVAASDEPWTIPLWVEIGEARARAGDIQGAFDVLKRFSDNNQYLKDMMDAMAPYLNNRGVAQQALQLLAASPNADAKFIGFQAIISAQAHMAGVGGASEYLAQMSRTSVRYTLSGQQGMSADSAAASQKQTESAMRTVAIALAKSGDLGRATDLALVIKDDSLRAESLLTIGTALAQAGDRQSAENTFKEADEAIRGIQDKSAQSRAIVQMARAEAQGKDTEAAFATAERLHRSDSWLNSFYEDALSEIALEQARSGDASAAMHTARLIATVGKKLTTLEDIATLQLRAGDRRGALIACQEGLQLIPAKSEIVELVSQIPAIAVIQANAGDPDTAARSLESALEMARALQSARDQSSVVADVAVAQVKIGEAEAAMRMSNRVPPGNWEAKNRVVKAIAESEALSNRPFDALRTMWEVDCPQGNGHRACVENHDFALAQVTRLLAKNGNEKLAFAWADKRNSPAARAKSYIEIAEGLLDQINPPLSLQEENTFDVDR